MDLKEQYDKLLRFCYMKTGDRNVAEDITQETFLKFWESQSYRDTGKEMAYLYTIARNLCIDFYRRGTAECIDDYPDIAAGTETNPEYRLDRMDLEAALSRLPEMLREMVVLRYTNELSVGDIAEIYHMSRFAVHRRLKEGLTCLKQYMEEGEKQI